MPRIITATLQRIAARVRRTRLAIAEQDLQWMEHIGRQNLARQRATVERLRNRVEADQVRASAEQIVARAEAALKRELLQQGGL